MIKRSLALLAFAAAEPPSPLLPSDLAVRFRGEPPSASIELSWALTGQASEDDSPSAPDFALAQARYELRTACGGAAPVLTAGVGPTARHVAADPAAIGVAPHASCAFAVRVWDGLGRASGWSAPARFPSLPPAAAFAPAWITEPAAKEDANTTLFRKAFHAAVAPKSAVVSVSGLGHYELTLNGIRVGDHMMDPGWTKYTANGSCLYSTYDVAALIKPGENALGVMTGNGMYNNVGPRYHKWTGSSGPRTLSLLLTVDGAAAVVSDATWQTKPGPV